MAPATDSKTGSPMSPETAIPDVPVALDDVVELADCLVFLSGWLASDPDNLGASLTRYVGSPGYYLTELRVDLHRFITLLVGEDTTPQDPPL